MHSAARNSAQARWSTQHRQARNSDQANRQLGTFRQSFSNYWTRPWLPSQGLKNSRTIPGARLAPAIRSTPKKTSTAWVEVMKRRAQVV